MIRIYDRAELTALFATVKYTSLQWTSRFYDIGSFEVHFPRGSEVEPYLVIGNYLTHGSKCGVILNVTYTSVDVQVVGRDTNVFLKWRVVVPPGHYLGSEADSETQIEQAYDRIKGTGEAVMKHYVKNHITEPTAEERKMANVTIAENEDRGISGEDGTVMQIAWQSRFGSLAEEIKELALYNELGYDFIFDPSKKKFIFDVYQGTDRTVNQSFVAPCIFTRERKSITDTEYSLDYLSAVSCVFVGGSGEEDEQTVWEVQNEEERPIYTEAYISSSGDIDELEDKGVAYLAENRPAENLTGAATNKLIYEEDWLLGDYVTVQERIGGTVYQVDLQITEVTETVERGNITIVPLFGEPKKDIIKILKG